MKKIVVIGGGTGCPTVLRGLKKYDLGIAAVVSMFDSGGSTGVLRDEFGVLPPGDVRRCLVALAEENGDSIIRELFNYRFENGGTLKGHSFGNLFLTALTKITGSDVEAIKRAGRILHIKGNVLPVSTDNSQLCAELENGEIIEGETNIDIPKHDASIKIKRLFLKPAATIFNETKEAIENADIIVIGPGDLYTSIIPNLLVKGVREALKTSKAKKVYICNLMTKWGETNNFKASDFALEIRRYAFIDLDYIVCNNKKVSRTILEKYEKENAFPVIIDGEIKKYAQHVIAQDLINESELSRHDSDKLAKVLVSL